MSYILKWFIVDDVPDVIPFGGRTQLSTKFMWQSLSHILSYPRIKDKL